MASQAGELFRDIAALGIQQSFRFQTMATIGYKLRREFRYAGHELFSVVFDEILRPRRDCFDMPPDRRQARVDIAH